MSERLVHIIKYSGESVPFSEKKLRHSLERSGAHPDLVSSILEQVKEELYEGITTKELYNRAYAILKKTRPLYASRYKLKKAIYELGPTGFPFEKFVHEILHYSGYRTEVGKVLSGRCVDHEIDVLAVKGERIILVECKFHGEQGRNCNVKIPLYINSRYEDVKASPDRGYSKTKQPDEAWVVTNTRFTEDAKVYGECMGLYLLSWDYPKKHSLKERIDRLGLYPITVSTLLSNREKQFLLSRDVVLCRQLMRDTFFLDHLGVSETRKKKILSEIAGLCQV
ncbi:ATP cone domain-containing protein [Lentiprolixibacter aurantiacus]|uniref:Restriction endonuclease n=1 Tax=Lentiprolixibacter aurantiacus TaxID=2993939 RepID=A0AAE3MMF7_9FLAO|nr:ATP cone domain-containing protein [Lentiprolixibacter aurantiacus]MCX2720103.1 restriction endonuclease [Lentiprolixibacter aurantiacus]